MRSLLLFFFLISPSVYAKAPECLKERTVARQRAELMCKAKGLKAHIKSVSPGTPLGQGKCFVQVRFHCDR